MPSHVYILKCADGSYYTGSTVNLARRIWQHEQGLSGESYTFSRRPVQLVWSYEFRLNKDALFVEYQIKGWTRAKKEALIRGEWDQIHEIVKAERKMREKKKNK